MSATTPHRATRPLTLTKHHGLGNDFLVALQFGSPVGPLDPCGPATAALARRLCDRRRGIGADGLIVARSGDNDERGVGEDCDAVMVLFNADGSRAEMSGNGVRCLAQALAMAGVGRTDNAAPPVRRLVVRTDAGPRALEVRPACRDMPADGDLPATNTVSVAVDMGAVTAGPSWQPSDAARGELGAMGVDERHVETVDIGNPHLVIGVADPWRVDVARIGPLLETDFPAGVNVQFIATRPGATDHLDLAVWERGAGVTEACGTGASAAATLAHRWGLVGPRVTVHMPGGTVDVVVAEDHTELIGPATYIARIEVDLG